MLFLRRAKRMHVEANILAALAVTVALPLLLMLPPLTALLKLIPVAVVVETVGGVWAPGVIKMSSNTTPLPPVMVNCSALTV